MAQPRMSGNKEEFVEWLHALSGDREKKGVQYLELYHSLFSSFIEADANKDGAIDLTEFDAMVEKTAYYPRKHGFAPKEADMFKTDEERLVHRAKLFEQMDRNKDKMVSFDEFLRWTYDHIMEKALGRGPF